MRQKSTKLSSMFTDEDADFTDTLEYTPMHSVLWHDFQVILMTLKCLIYRYQFSQEGWVFKNTNRVLSLISKKINLDWISGCFQASLERDFFAPLTWQIAINISTTKGIALYHIAAECSWIRNYVVFYGPPFYSSILSFNFFVKTI